MPQPIPDHCNSLNANVIVSDGDAALDFYCKAFDGRGTVCMRAPDGSFMHGEVRIGNSTLMVSQENLEWDCKSAKTLGGSPISFYLYVEDCDSAFQQAIAAGCEEASPLTDAFWGDRCGRVMDPFGLQWCIATRKENLTAEEVKERGAAWFREFAGE